MPSVNRRKSMVLWGLVLFLCADVASAQGIFIARRVIGKIAQMSQSSPNGETTYDTASVIIEVPVDRVYAVVKTQVSTAKSVTVTREDAAARRIEFTDGTRIAGIQAVSLGDNVTQLMVSAAHSKSPMSSPTSIVVEHIVATCKAMNIECTRGG